MYKISMPEFTEATDDWWADSERSKEHRRRIKPIIVRYSKDRGLTGISIRSRKIIISAEGEYDAHFAPEIDKCISSVTVRNCMVGPAYDSEGRLRGVVQCLNKKNEESISN